MPYVPLDETIYMLGNAVTATHPEVVCRWRFTAGSSQWSGGIDRGSGGTTGRASGVSGSAAEGAHGEWGEYCEDACGPEQ
jgi:hypothetical protein